MLVLRCLVCVLLLSLLAAEPTGASRPPPPNIVVIMADDLDAGTLAHFPRITDDQIGRAHV